MGRDPTGAQGKGNANDENTGGVHLTEAEVCVFCILCFVFGALLSLPESDDGGGGSRSRIVQHEKII